MLIGAGLLLRSFVAFVTFDHGYNPADIAVFLVVQPGDPVGPDPSAVAENYGASLRVAETLLAGVERIEQLPGVDAVALAHVMPIFNAEGNERIGVAGRPPPVDPRQQQWAGIRAVSPGYADVLQLRVQAGRFFTDRDAAGSPQVVVVSESFARRAFGDAPAVGQRLVRPDVAGAGAATWEVIGVVDDITSPFLAARNRRLVTDIYVSILQPGMTPRYALQINPIVLVRSDRTPLTLLAFLRELPFEFRPSPGATIDAVLSSQVAQPRFYAMSAGSFGTVALLLSAFGLYGVLSHAVAQRRREIGVRMALGAGRGDVVGLVVRQGGRLVAAGVIIGLLGAGATTRVVEHMLFDITPADPLTFAAVTAMLLVAGLLACWLPARRAARIDPMEALRET